MPNPIKAMFISCHILTGSGLGSLLATIPYGLTHNEHNQDDLNDAVMIGAATGFTLTTSLWLYKFREPILENLRQRWAIAHYQQGYIVKAWQLIAFLKYEKPLEARSENHDYNCPIHFEMMADPYKLNCGHNFDKVSLDSLKRDTNHPVNQGQKVQCCPLCRTLVLEAKPNIELQKLILEEFEKMPKEENAMNPNSTTSGNKFTKFLSCFSVFNPRPQLQTESATEEPIQGHPLVVISRNATV